MFVDLVCVATSKQIEALFTFEARRRKRGEERAGAAEARSILKTPKEKENKNGIGRFNDLNCWRRC